MDSDGGGGERRFLRSEAAAAERHIDGSGGIGGAVGARDCFQYKWKSALGQQAKQLLLGQAGMATLMLWEKSLK